MSDQTADFGADQIVPASINADAHVNEAHAQGDDVKRWIKTLLASLNTRSRAAHEALTKALLDGQDVVTSVGHLSGLEKPTLKNKENQVMSEQHETPSSSPHLSGTILIAAMDV